MQSYDFVQEYHTSENLDGTFHQNQSYTAVVDNNSLQLTPLGRLLIPPPMCEHKIELEDFPRCFAFHKHIMIVLQDKGLAIITAEKSTEKKSVQPYEFIPHPNDGKLYNPKRVYRMLLKLEETKEEDLGYQGFDGSLFLLEDLHSEGFGETSRSRLIELRISPSGLNSHKIDKTHSIVLSKKVFSWCICSGTRQHEGPLGAELETRMPYMLAREESKDSGAEQEGATSTFIYLQYTDKSL